MNKTKHMTIPERAEYLVELTELPCRKNHEKQLRIVAFELMQKIKRNENKQKENDMSFKFTSYDKQGNPTHVSTNDGFAQTSRPFDAENDAWMLEQLRMTDFSTISAGREMEYLVNEVNELRRENFELNKMVNKMHFNL